MLVVFIKTLIIKTNFRVVDHTLMIAMTLFEELFNIWEVVLIAPGLFTPGPVVRSGQSGLI